MIIGFASGQTWRTPEWRSICMTAKENWPKTTPGRRVDSQRLELALLARVPTILSWKLQVRLKSGPPGQWFTATNERGLLHNARCLPVLFRTLFGLGKPSLLLRKIELMRK